MKKNTKGISKIRVCLLLVKDWLVWRERASMLAGEDYSDYLTLICKGANGIKDDNKCEVELVIYNELEFERFVAKQKLPMSTAREIVAARASWAAWTTTAEIIEVDLVKKRYYCYKCQKYMNPRRHTGKPNYCNICKSPGWGVLPKR